MTSAVCIGALASDGKYIRLLNEGGYNQPLNTEFEVRQVWEVEYEERINKKPPHIEDVIVKSKILRGTLKGEISMLQIVQRFKAAIWKGSPDVLFDGLLQWTDSGSGYVSENGNIPKNSVGFWIPDKDLTKQIFYEKVRYNYPKLTNRKSLPYVGFEQAIDIIPAGTLVRVSLARWWDTNGTTEDRCSLQLSGWYELQKNLDDLPF